MAASKPLAAFARSVIESAVRGAPAPPVPDGLPDRGPHGGVFVTLHKFGRLRGCMGCLDASLAVADCLRVAASDAALGDPRFPAVGVGELPDLRIEVSVMSSPERTADPLALELGKHGILIRRGRKRGLFLPQVATEHHLDTVTFLSRCCGEKAGLPPDAWRDAQTEVLLFTTTVESESD